jgi:peptide/nickel transport system substrate-binding protein
MRVRKALSLAMNKDRIMKDLYDSKSDHNGCVPNGHTRYSLTPDEYKALYKFDAEQARALLGQAGVSNLTFELLAWNDNQVYLDEMQMYQQDLKNVGVTMNIKTLPIRTGREFVLQGNFEANVGAHTQGASPDEILGAFTKGDPFNYMRLDDPRVQTWMAQQETEYDTARRWPIFKEFAKVCAEEVLGLIPLPNRYSFTLTQGYVKNYLESDLSTDEPKEWWVWIER